MFAITRSSIDLSPVVLSTEPQLSGSYQVKGSTLTVKASLGSLSRSETVVLPPVDWIRLTQPQAQAIVQAYQETEVKIAPEMTIQKLFVVHYAGYVVAYQLMPQIMMGEWLPFDGDQGTANYAELICLGLMDRVDDPLTVNILRVIISFNRIWGTVLPVKANGNYLPVMIDTYFKTRI